ncbi:PTS transporter subunit IIC [Corynebacterium mendelii]|nr:PTS sugar transporter subunit IIC [Corynebacterium mendelii]
MTDQTPSTASQPQPAEDVIRGQQARDPHRKTELKATHGIELGGPGAFTMKVLNGIAIAVVVSLAPTALLGFLLKAMLPVFPQGAALIELTSLAATTMPVLIGVFIAMQFKLTPIQTGSVAIAAVAGSGIAKLDPAGGFHIQGTGLVINTGLTAALAVLLISFVGTRLGSYTMLLLSTIVTVVVGGIGAKVTYPVVYIFTVWLGDAINQASTLQPVPMGIVLSLIFCVLIVSPVSTVGVATAIMMSGISSGVANLGCVASAVCLMVLAWRANGTAIGVLHFFCSPKIQMPNMVARPKAYLPVVVVAPILGAAGGALGVEGTAVSAGFGITGFAGPLAALQAEGWGFSPANILIVVCLYLVAPLLLAFASTWLFRDVLGWVSPEDYRLDFE